MYKVLTRNSIPLEKGTIICDIQNPYNKSYETIEPSGNVIKIFGCPFIAEIQNQLIPLAGTYWQLKNYNTELYKLPKAIIKITDSNNGKLSYTQYQKDTRRKYEYLKPMRMFLSQYEWLDYS